MLLGNSAGNTLLHMYFLITIANANSMDGMDKPSKGVYGTSLPLATAMDRLADIMVAYEKDGQPIPPDHGFPFRMIIPGYVGGRMVKWLKKIYISDKESTSYYHFYDNRLLPPPPIGPANNEEAAAGEWFMKPEFIIYERQINSVTVSPEHDQVINLEDESDTFLIKVYAHSGKYLS
jgi:nitrate reductase (NAD(P)H)